MNFIWLEKLYTQGKKYIQNGGAGYNFKCGGLIRRRLSNGGYLSE